jgi:hypothetical protein
MSSPKSPKSPHPTSSPRAPTSPGGADDAPLVADENPEEGDGDSAYGVGSKKKMGYEAGHDGGL